MAKSLAERQAAYSAKQQEGDGGKKLCMWVTTGCNNGLARLAKHHGMTKRELLMMLVKTADDAIIKQFDFDSPELNRYIDAK